jgi:PAS domain S-box-containing protein
MFTPSTGEFTGDVLHYYLTDHLIYSLLADGNENLWISTSRGILAFNTTTSEIHSFDKFDGLQETAFIYGSYYKSASGELFFGGIKGCNSFHPDSIRLNLKVPQIVITSFNISGKKGVNGINELTGKSVMASKRVSTPYYQNNIALTFSALDYNMPAKNRFRYKLEGYDREWTETNAARRYVNYTNLAPGKYIFRVIGSNSDDIWNHEGTSVVINIEPPFWKTTGFFIILILFLAGSVAFVVYLILRKYQREKQQLEMVAISSVQDERKQLRTLIDNIPDLIFIKDRESRFTLANNKVAAVMGTVPEKLIGKTDFDFYEEDTAKAYFSDEQKIMETGTPLINFEETAHNEFGNRTIRSTTKVPVRNKDGEIIGIAGVCRDITKLKNIENQLRKKSDDLQETNRLLENRQKEILIQSEELAEQTQNLLMINAELERLNRTKDKLFSIIAHDLRNPFNAIIGFSELLRHDFYDMDNAQKLNVLELINISSQTAYNLLENLLQWARTQTDKINFSPEDFNLHEIAAGVIDLHCVTARKKGITIKNEIADDMHVHADKNMISTVLRNLVSNAIKFSNPDGEIVISVRDNSKSVEVKVADCGVGMDRDSLNKLFRIDTYYSTAGTMGESGTGLGLIICKEFIEKNNGRIKAISNPGEGTTMMFTLSKGKV